MIATPEPVRPAPNRWEGRHLYRLPRHVYIGSVVRESFTGRWAAWRRGAYLGSFTDEDGARAALEEYANEQLKPER